MVTALSKYMLEDDGCIWDPALVASVTRDSENDCWDYLTHYSAAVNKITKERDGLKVKAEAEQWANSLPGANETRRKCILEKLQEAKRQPGKYDTEELLRQYRVYAKKETEITPIDIQRAKEHPIEQILDTQGRKGNISCPFHDDKNPSFSIKNNRFKCFSCGEHGDIIDLYQKLHNVSFKEAVNQLK